MSKNNIQVETVIIKEFPVKEINNYMDKVVFGIARATLDLTNTKRRFPYRTGNLNQASMSEGVQKKGYANYFVGARGVDYAPKVWNYPSTTNWTNKSTYPQWYYTEFIHDKNVIVSRAIKQALGELK